MKIINSCTLSLLCLIILFSISQQNKIAYSLEKNFVNNSIKNSLSQITTTSSSTSSTTTSSNTNSSIKSNSSKKNELEHLFIKPRLVSCFVTNTLQHLKYEIDLCYHKKGKNTGKFSWIKKWGSGPVAFLFDFLDSMLRAEIVKEFKSLIELTKAFKQKINDYTDPFDYLARISKTNEKDHKSLTKIYREFKAHYKPNVYKNSIRHKS